jgi:asparagine synthase (glutamine-hydrolysing)
VGDPLTVPNLLLARAAAADGLKVLLNGEGGDPLFGGPKNIPMMVYEWHRTNADPLDRARAYLRSYRKCYTDLPQLLNPDVLDALQDAPPLERLVQPYLESPRMSHYLNRLMYANTRLKGSHHILTKVERLTSSCGLEGRSPIFDPAVVQYAFAIPPQLKLAGVNEKWILKQAVQDLLPGLIIDRPKSGMRVPVQHWLAGPLRTLSRDLLLGRRARERGLFNPQTIQTWLRGEGKIWPRHGAALWLVLTLEIWLRAYLDQ